MCARTVQVKAEAKRRAALLDDLVTTAAKRVRPLKYSTDAIKYIERDGVSSEVTCVRIVESEVRVKAFHGVTSV
eukprot:22356-Eustigmatos_ZCMA.PRE.1